MSVTLDLHEESKIRVITLSDPARLNAIGDELRNGLAEQIHSATTDSTCRAIVITGANGAFSSGGELASMPTDPDAIRARIGRLHEIVTMLAGAPQLVISAVDGVAFGSGMSLAAAGDIVIAGDTAKFGCTFGRVGLIPDVGFMWSARRRMGIRRTRLVVLQNLVIDADTAEAWGLVDIRCPTGEALESALQFASRLVRTPAGTISSAKRMLEMEYPTIHKVLEDEMTTQIEMLGTEEFAAAREKFLSRKTV